MARLARRTRSALLGGRPRGPDDLGGNRGRGGRRRGRARRAGRDEGGNGHDRAQVRCRRGAARLGDARRGAGRVRSHGGRVRRRAGRRGGAADGDVGRRDHRRGHPGPVLWLTRPVRHGRLRRGADPRHRAADRARDRRRRRGGGAVAAELTVVVRVPQLRPGRGRGARGPVDSGGPARGGGA